MLGNKAKAKADRLASAHAMVEQGGYGGSNVYDTPQGMSFWNPKEEKVYEISIVPYDVTKAIKKFVNQRAKPGQLYFERTFHVHYIGNRPYLCARETYGGPCAVCEKVDEMYADPELNEDKKKAANKIRAKSRQLFNVFVHSEPKKGVQLWDISWHLFGQYLSNKIKKAPEGKSEKYNTFFDPSGGYYFRCSPTASTGGTGRSYLDFTDIEFKRRKEGLPENLLSGAADLDAIINPAPDYDELRDILMGGGGKKKDEDKSDDEDDDEDGDDQDEDDSDLDDEDEEDVKPSKNPKKKPKPGEDEEDDDDTGDEESDEDGEDDEEDEQDDEDEDNDDDGDEEADGDDDDTDDDEGGDEDDPKLTKGNKVRYVRKGVTKRGVIKSINYSNGLALVLVKGAEKPTPVEIGKLTLDTGKTPAAIDDEEEEEDDEPLPRPKKRGK